MNYFLILVALSLSGSAIAASPIPAVSFEDQADASWTKRDVKGQTETAIAMWTEALNDSPHRAEILVKLTKACGRAVRHSEAPAEKIKWADQAREFAEKAVAENSQSSDAYAVQGEALGQWAEAHKGIHSPAAVKTAIQSLKKAIALNGNNAYAHMLLSQFYRETPRVLGGNKAKALDEGKLAVADGPGYAINHLALAKAYLAQGQKKACVAELETTLTLTPPEDAVQETKADQESARTLLKSLKVPVSDTPPKPLPSGKSHQSSCGEMGGICSEK